ncbi:CopG family transcriptional regulator [Myceligenerans xiligouense]|nr:CopG family transcriptional regulator [Myceligenerans xiligouense]
MAEKMGKYSITMPKDVAEAARQYAGSSGLSAFIASTMEEKIQGLRLDEFLNEYEAEHGEFTDEELAAADREIDQAYEAMLSRRAQRAAEIRGEG